MCLNGLVDGNEPRLNFDVLRSVCNNLTDVPDVLSFALTCSALRKGALQRRLGMSPFVLSLPDSVERLHIFISADPTSRAPYLYGLRLYSDWNYAPNGDLRFINYLVAIMKAATRLEYLYFPTVLGSSVCTAVTKMGMLRELVVVSDAPYLAPPQSEASNRLLTALRSPLRCLAVTNHEIEQISTSFLHDDLHYFAPTLEYLDLDYLHFNIHPSSVTTPFTAMRSLRIVSTFISRFYQVDVILRLFPNLDGTLFLKGCRPPVDQYPTLREQGKEAQRDHTWSGLDRVACSADVAFLMALQCPIRHMDIIEPVQHEASYLAEALRDSCPRHLLLPIAFSRRHNDLQSLRGIFPREAADSLSHLVLFADIGVYQQRRGQTGERDCFSWVQFLDSLVDSLKHLRLTHLRIVFYYDIFPPDPDLAQPDAGCARDEGFAENVAHDADLHPAAIRLLDAVQTLQYLFLTTCGVRRYGEPWKYWHSSRAWRVVGVDAEDPRLPVSDAKTPRGSCVEIQVSEDIDVVEAVIDEEELYLGHREERMVQHCMESASK